MSPALPSAVPLNDNVAAQPRAQFWDVVRGLGIVLVVYGHVARGLLSASILTDSSLWTSVDAVIYSFHMPLFFFISGRFFPSSYRKQGFGSLMGRKLSTLAYPYLLWSLIQGAIESLTAGLTNHGARTRVSGILAAPIDQFWFLYALFFIFLIAATAYRTTTRPPWVLVSTAVILFLCDFSRSAWSGWGYIAYYLLFFAMGCLSAPAWKWRLTLRTWQAIALAAACLVALLLLNLGPASSPISDGLLGARAIPFARATAGCGLVFCVARLVSGISASLLAVLGRYSMEIYLMHIIVASGARIALARFLALQSPAVHLALGLVAGVFIPVLIARQMHRHDARWLVEWPRPNQFRRS